MEFRNLDQKYMREFNYETSEIVRISNGIIKDEYETFHSDVNSKFQFHIIPLSYFSVYGRVGCIQIEGLIKLFESFDSDFEKYLDIGRCLSEESAVKEVHRLLQKEMGGAHKYYLITLMPDMPIGIIYVYDYKAKYKTCNIAYGILKEYREKGFCVEVVKVFTEELLNQGIVRVGLEIEDTNTRSILMCKNNLKDFSYEGTKLNAYGPGINSLVFSKVVVNENKEDVLSSAISKVNLSNKLLRGERNNEVK